MMDDAFLDINMMNAEKSPEAGKVVERKLHTLTTIRQYPNGQIFVVKTQTWLDKQRNEFKKKPKKTVEATQVVIQKEEVY